MSKEEVLERLAELRVKLRQVALVAHTVNQDLAAIRKHTDRLFRDSNSSANVGIVTRLELTIERADDLAGATDELRDLVEALIRIAPQMCEEDS